MPNLESLQVELLRRVEQDGHAIVTGEMMSTLFPNDPPGMAAPLTGLDRLETFCRKYRLKVTPYNRMDFLFWEADHAESH